jgi:Domain of Unknown Function (DUF1080)
MNAKCLLALSLLVCAATMAAEKQDGFVSLFPEDGVPKGWTVRKWNELKEAADPGVVWKVEKGVLHGSEPRGTWLISEKEYGDFVLEFEWKLGERGNSGTALRSPLFGDPAFDGLELQMVDPRYYPPEMPVAPDELTASLYKAVAPKEQLFKPMDWNQYRITCKGPKISVDLNGKTVQDIDLDAQTKSPKRHDGTDAPPLKNRPRRGHIGFQELSRGGGHVEIRNARIKIRTDQRKDRRTNGVRPNTHGLTPTLPIGSQLVNLFPVKVFCHCEAFRGTAPSRM